MHVFLAGSTSVLGRRVLPLLLDGGHQVTALIRDPRQAPQIAALGAGTAVADARDRGAVAAAVAAARPDVVMQQLTDLASGTSASNAALRISATRSLVDAALAAGVQRVIAQSIAWASEPGSEPADEATSLDVYAEPARRMTVNGINALEQATREAPEWVVLRYGLLYGNGTWYPPAGARGVDARAGRLVADADISSFVKVDDAAAAAVDALHWPSGVATVCDDEPAAGHDWLPAFCAAVGAPPPATSTRPRTPWARGASNRHVREDLGWAPSHRSWRTGFQAMSHPCGEDPRRSKRDEPDHRSP